MTCWICRAEIARWEHSKDHLHPKTFGQRETDLYRSAHVLCNHARANLSIEEVQEIQDRLDRKYGAEWLPVDIRIELAVKRHPRARTKLTRYYQVESAKQFEPRFRLPKELREESS